MSNKIQMIGWREWVKLPNLGINWLKAKVDTGARTSVLHAFQVDVFDEDGCDKVRFSLHPRRNSKREVVCTADLLDIRWVTDSGGHKEQRCVIQTELVLAGEYLPIEMTLTSRDTMRFRMLIGRTALPSHFLINPNASYLTAKPVKKTDKQ